MKLSDSERKLLQRILAPANPEVTKFPKFIKATEKSAQYGVGGKTKFGYDEFVEWPDGERTLLRKEKTPSGTYYRTEGRYEIGSQMPDIGATDRQVLLSKVSQRWAELQKAVKPTAIPKAEAVPKSPWQMTIEEFHASRQKSPFAVDWMEAKFLHRDIVKEALSEGKPVPPEVLKDYPDLVPMTEPMPQVKSKGGLAMSADRDKLIKELEMAASEESDAAKMYHDLSDLADSLGYRDAWVELHDIAMDEAKHHDALLNILDAIKSKKLA